MLPENAAKDPHLPTKGCVTASANVNLVLAAQLSICYLLYMWLSLVHIFTRFVKCSIDGFAMDSSLP